MVLYEFAQSTVYHFVIDRMPFVVFCVHLFFLIAYDFDNPGMCL